MCDRQDFVEVDVSAIASSRELHAALAAALQFPEFYGHNWDAFWDAITGLVSMPRRLRFVGWEALRKRLPGEAGQLQSCLTDLQRQYPDSAPDVEYG